MKKSLVIPASALAIMAGCSDGKTKLPGNLYPAEYTVVEGMPHNIQLNSHSTWERTDSFPGYSSLNFSYPEYGADGFLTVVMADSAKMLKAMNHYLEIMEMRADTTCDIIESRSPNGIYSWIFIHPSGKEQIQWMSTDSVTMYAGGRVHLKAASDSTIDITPALDNIRIDIEHLINNINPIN